MEVLRPTKKNLAHSESFICVLVIKIKFRVNNTKNSAGMRIKLFSLDPDPAQLKNNPDPYPTLIRNEEKIYI